MTALTTSLVPAPFAQGFASVATVVGLAFRRLVHAWRHRRDAVVLASLDDRMLADVGLTRADLNDALSEPLWRDPTAVLARRQGERRRFRRGAVADLISFPPRDPPARLTV
jgi:uncharacterized protein YjiS (DUF1127 family)